MNNWFTRREVAPGIWHIEEPAYRADYRCNVFLVQGQKFDVVIDSGLGLASLREFIAPLSENPVLIASHSHYDHMGSNHEFEERWAHVNEAAILAHPTRENTFGELLLADDDFAFAPHENFTAPNWQPQAAPVTELLQDDEIIDLGNRKFQVIHAPGHSPGLICLWDEANKILFSTDAVYDGEIFDFLPCSNIPTYIETMKKLRVLPVETAYPCHNEIIDGARFRVVINNYLAEKGTL
jgi:glyoxylase-like metal-dependent hydrolase (beta-lactamase superfamily II)